MTLTRWHEQGQVWEIDGRYFFKYLFLKNIFFYFLNLFLILIYQNNLKLIFLKIFKNTVGLKEKKIYIRTFESPLTYKIILLFII
jgi:hypothetical protein